MVANLQIKFWGVRGSVSCSGHDYMRYGGNTSCVEIRCGEHILIFDAGTGLKSLGETLNPCKDNTYHLFFSHTHLDHISGLPFFKPLFNPKNTFHLWAGHLLPEYNLRDTLEQIMSEPIFPVPPDIFQADLHLHDFHSGHVLTPFKDIIIKTAPLNHPNGATGYRVEYQGKSVCYVTDTEHIPGTLDSNILGLIHQADYVIYDCTYLDEEFERFKGWGHSTWQEGARLCDHAGAKTLIIFHHDPYRNDVEMTKIAHIAENQRPGTIIAYEGLEITL